MIGGPQNMFSCSVAQHKDMYRPVHSPSPLVGEDARIYCCHKPAMQALLLLIMNIGGDKMKPLPLRLLGAHCSIKVNA